jgi:uncharacterized protein YwqG
MEQRKHGITRGEVMINREHIRQQLVDVGLTRVANTVAQLARPCIRLSTTSSHDPDIPVGASKFGGLPDLPADFLWPAWNQQPLAFLGQVNLGEIAANPIAAPLPSEGLLSFFNEAEQSTWGNHPDDRGSWRVYLFPPQLLQRSAPAMPLPDYASYRPCTLSFTDGVTFPGWGSSYIEALHLNNAEGDLYQTFKSAGTTDSYGHQLLGHPTEVQNEMQLECQLASNGIICASPEDYQTPRARELAPGASQWRLLFQCDSDDKVGWTWGDVGLLYFWITEADLESQQFANTWMILQSF